MAHAGASSLFGGGAMPPQAPGGPPGGGYAQAQPIMQQQPPGLQQQHPPHAMAPPAQQQQPGAPAQAGLQAAVGVPYDANRHKFPAFPAEGPESYSADGIRYWLSLLDLRPEPCGRSPARWVPDAHESCTNCPLTGLQFDWVRRKHHCRLCGGVFSLECCSRRAMLPDDVIVENPDPQRAKGQPKDVNKRNPQRVCDVCFEAALPLQDYLLPSANSEQDLPFETGEGRRWLNVPISFSMEEEIKKAATTVRNFTVQGIIKDRSIPLPLLQKAKGLAFMTVFKAGFVLTGKVGTGIVVARQRDGSWSAPSAVATLGAGWGMQAGAEVTDYVLLLNTNSAVDAFGGAKQFTLGAELSVAVGPVGRAGGSEVHGGGGGVATVYTYSHSKGLFAGVSMEGSCIVTRAQVNKNFYGVDHDVRKLLSGEVISPPAAMPLYEALQEALSIRGVIAGDSFAGGGGVSGGVTRGPGVGAAALFGNAPRASGLFGAGGGPPGAGAPHGPPPQYHHQQQHQPTPYAPQQQPYAAHPGPGSGGAPFPPHAHVPHTQQPPHAHAPAYPPHAAGGAPPPGHLPGQLHGQLPGQPNHMLAAQPGMAAQPPPPAPEPAAPPVSDSFASKYQDPVAAAAGGEAAAGGAGGGDEKAKEAPPQEPGAWDGGTKDGGGVNPFASDDTHSF
eukprot:g6840.t1